MFKNIPFFNKIFLNPDYLKISKNIGWLFLDKVLRMGVGLILNVWIARYLEPQGYGIINYGIIFGSLVAALCGSGLDGVIVKELLDKKNNSSIVIGNFFLVRVVLGTISFVIISIYVLGFLRNDAVIVASVLIISFGNLFVSFDTIDSYYQSILSSKFSVFAKNISFIIVSSFRIYLLYYQFDIYYFIFSYFVEMALSAIFMILSFYINLRKSFFDFKIDTSLMFTILKRNYLLIGGTLLYVLYLKTDQLLISSMINKKELGIYSAALKLSEIWFFIPVIVTGSLYPMLIQLKSENENLYLQRISYIFKISMIVGIVFSVCISSFSESIITIIYGDKFKSAAIVLTLHIWSGIFVFWEYISNYYLYIENHNYIIFYRILICAILSIVLNLILIPIWGLTGAAVSSLISHIGMSTFIFIFFKVSYPLLSIQLKAFVDVIMILPLFLKSKFVNN